MKTIIEVPSGSINGINTVFSVSNPYIANTVTIFINGIPRLKEDADGWFETTPNQGIITLKEVLSTGDRLQIAYSYFDTSIETIQQTIYLYGEISLDFAIDGKIEESTELGASLEKY